MGAAPSRQCQHQYLADIGHAAAAPHQSGSHGDSRALRKAKRKRVTLLPLTKLFMNRIQAPDGPAGLQRGEEEERERPVAHFVPDAAPATLPLMQQLFEVYREPSVRYYGRREGWGPLDRLPSAALGIQSVDELYAMTVATYERRLYDTDEAMLDEWERAKLQEELGEGPSWAQRRRVMPIPCAICFEYPTSRAVEEAGPTTPGSQSSGNSTNNSIGGKMRKFRASMGAPADSIVLCKGMSYMVAGFIGLVPVYEDRRGQQQPAGRAAGGEEPGAAFMKMPPSADPADATVYEPFFFISKTAGEQHLCRTIYQAAFLYLDQCRRVGIAGLPQLPRLQFSCLRTDIPYLCMLRELRERLMEDRLPLALLRPLLAAVGRHGQMVRGVLEEGVARQLTTFLAESYANVTFHAPRHLPHHFFYGFVEDGAPAQAQRRLPDPADRRALLARLQTQIDAWRLDRQTEDASASTVPTATTTAQEEKDVYAVVGARGYTMGSRTLPPQTLLRQRFHLTTGRPLLPSWEVVPSAEDTAPAEAIFAEDVVVSWLKTMYKLAQKSDAADTHWVARDATPVAPSSPQQLPPPPRRAAAPTPPALTTAALRLQQQNYMAGGRGGASASRDADAEASTSPTAAGFRVWEFEFQGEPYSIGLVPMYARDAGQEDTVTSSSLCSTSRPQTLTPRQQQQQQQQQQENAKCGGGGGAGPATASSDASGVTPRGGKGSASGHGSRRNSNGPHSRPLSSASSGCGMQEWMGYSIGASAHAHGSPTVATACPPVGIASDYYINSYYGNMMSDKRPSFYSNNGSGGVSESNPICTGNTTTMSTSFHRNTAPPSHTVYTAAHQPMGGGSNLQRSHNSSTTTSQPADLPSMGFSGGRASLTGLPPPQPQPYQQVLADAPRPPPLGGLQRRLSASKGDERSPSAATTTTWKSPTSAHAVAAAAAGGGTGASVSVHSTNTAKVYEGKGGEKKYRWNWNSDVLMK